MSHHCIGIPCMICFPNVYTHTRFATPVLGRPKADEYYEDVDSPQDTTSANVGNASNDSDLSALLLDLIGEAARLKTLLAEADADAFKENEKRLATFFDLVASVPRTPPAKKVVGFKPPEPVAAAKKTRKKKKNTAP
jgi:hypothetical protein